MRAAEEEVVTVVVVGYVRRGPWPCHGVLPCLPRQLCGEDDAVRSDLSVSQAVNGAAAVRAEQDCAMR